MQRIHDSILYIFFVSLIVVVVNLSATPVRAQGVCTQDGQCCSTSQVNTKTCVGTTELCSSDAECTACGYTYSCLGTGDPNDPRCPANYCPSGQTCYANAKTGCCVGSATTCGSSPFAASCVPISGGQCGTSCPSGSGILVPCGGNQVGGGTTPGVTPTSAPATPTPMPPGGCGTGCIGNWNCSGQFAAIPNGRGPVCSVNGGGFCSDCTCDGGGGCDPSGSCTQGTTCTPGIGCSAGERCQWNGSGGGYVRNPQNGMVVWSNNGGWNCVNMGCPPPPQTAVSARGKYVVDANATCTDVNTSTSPAVGTVLQFTTGSTGGAAPQTQTDINYKTWSRLGNTVQTLDPIAPAGASVVLACWANSNGLFGQGLSAVAPSNGTLTWNLGIVSPGPWYQTSGGDVYVLGQFKSYIPSVTSPRYFSTVGAGGFPGIMTYSSTYDFDSGTGLGESYVSSKNWLANDTYGIINLYDAFYRRFGSPTASTTGFNAVSGGKPANGVYYVNGDAIIDNPWNVGNNDSVIIIVNGTLSIRKAITLTGSGNGFMAFIAKNGISVDATVGVNSGSTNSSIDGVYITSGTFDTGVGNGGNERLIGKGMYIANSFILRRTLGSGNDPTTPATTFIYYPQFLLTMPDAMKEVATFWQEVAPDDLAPTPTIAPPTPTPIATPTPSLPGPYAWWRLDECQGVNAQDSSGNGNIGTIAVGGGGTQTAVGTCQTGSTAWGNGATGKFSASLGLDGTDDGVDVSSVVSTLKGSAVTISMWFKTNATDFAHHLFWAGEPTGNGWGTQQEMHITLGANSATGVATPNVLNFDMVDAANQYSGNVGNDLYITTPFTDTGSFHNVVVVINGNTATMYLDGTAVGTDTATTLSKVNWSQAFIGRPGAAGARFFNGKIDDVRIYNSALSASQVSSLYGSTPSPSPTPPLGPIAYWKLDESSGQAAVDSSGYGNDGMLGANTSVGADDPTRSGGYSGGGLTFDGGDYVCAGSSGACTNNAALQLQTLTVEAWIKKSSITATQGVVGYGASDGNSVARGYHLSVQSDGKAAFAKGNTGLYANQRASGTTVVANGSWHHLVGTFDNTTSTIKIYVDGNLEDSKVVTSGVSYANANHFAIGAALYGPTYYYFTGQIDEVRVYNKVLTLSEVQSLYAQTPLPTPTPGAPTATPTPIPPTPTPVPPPSGFTFCANEGGYCSYSGGIWRVVRYGANGSYIQSGFPPEGTACNNVVFGDPAPGVPKHCDVFY